MKGRVVLSGMRPTGKLHFGNMVGALSSWIKLQSDSTTRCFYMVADWHALTTDYQDTSIVEDNIEDMVLDWLAAGLDPKKSVIFRQSWVPEHAEFALLLSMITPLSWLERNPTYKEQVTELKDKEISTHGFLGYPVLQAADILLYQASHVPVGEDQLPHLELTREIARRFNFLYKKPVLVEPSALLSKSPKVLGTDARKMSKSYDNCVYISEPESSLKKKINSMFTDPHKVRADDPGHPKPCPENPTGCVVFSLHDILEVDRNAFRDREERCRDGRLGCAACKKDLLETMTLSLKPVREKREVLIKEKNIVSEILIEGSRTAQLVAQETMNQVLDAIHFKKPIGMFP